MRGVCTQVDPVQQPSCKLSGFLTPAWGARPAVPLCMVLTLLMLHTICGQQGMPRKCEHPLTDALRAACFLLLALPLRYGPRQDISDHRLPLLPLDQGRLWPANLQKATHPLPYIPGAGQLAAACFNWQHQLCKAHYSLNGP